MINRIMKTGVAAVALAASALLATSPAYAQSGDRFRQDRSFNDLRGGPDAGFRDFRSDHNVRGRGKARLNKFGQTPKEVKYLTAQALEACICQLEIDAYKYGFEDAGFHSTPYLEQVGHNAFIVKGGAKLYDGYNVSKQSYECAVRRGKIVNASGLFPSRNAKGFRKGRSNRFRGGFSGISFSFGQRW